MGVGTVILIILASLFIGVIAAVLVVVLNHWKSHSRAKSFSRLDNEVETEPSTCSTIPTNFEGPGRSTAEPQVAFDGNCVRIGHFPSDRDGLVLSPLYLPEVSSSVDLSNIDHQFHCTTVQRDAISCKTDQTSSYDGDLSQNDSQSSDDNGSCHYDNTETVEDTGGMYIEDHDTQVSLESGRVICGEVFPGSSVESLRHVRHIFDISQPCVINIEHTQAELATSCTHGTSNVLKGYGLLSAARSAEPHSIQAEQGENIYKQDTSMSMLLVEDLLSDSHSTNSSHRETDINNQSSDDNGSFHDDNTETVSSMQGDLPGEFKNTNNDLMYDFESNTHSSHEDESDYDNNLEGADDDQPRPELGDVYSLSSNSDADMPEDNIHAVHEPAPEVPLNVFFDESSGEDSGVGSSPSSED